MHIRSPFKFSCHPLVADLTSFALEKLNDIWPDRDPFLGGQACDARQGIVVVSDGLFG